MKILINIFLIFLLSNVLMANQPRPLDSLVSYNWGEGQNFGQDEEYFPENVLGMPDTTASEQKACNLPEQVCSLGVGGEIVLALKNFTIKDNSGPDFIVFENAFLNPVTNKVFAEPGIVSVSKDGINFVEFPWDTATLIGCAGLEPTLGSKVYSDFLNSGGDKFDLEDIGIDEIKYIKIKDNTEFLKNHPEHKYYDPILTGFDLDAIVALNYRPDISDVEDRNQTDIAVYSKNNRIIIENKQECRVAIYNVTGMMISESDIQSGISYISSELATGAYFIVFQTGAAIFTRKVLVY